MSQMKPNAGKYILKLPNCMINYTTFLTLPFARFIISIYLLFFRICKLIFQAVLFFNINQTIIYSSILNFTLANARLVKKQTSKNYNCTHLHNTFQAKYVGIFQCWKSFLCCNYRFINCDSHTCIKTSHTHTITNTHTLA